MNIILDSYEQPWVGYDSLQRKQCCIWCRDHGIDPDNTYRIELIGEGQFLVYGYKLNTAGNRYVDPRTMDVACYSFTCNAHSVPPWLL